MTFAFLLALLAILGIAIYAQWNGTLGSALEAFMGGSSTSSGSKPPNVGGALGIG